MPHAKCIVRIQIFYCKCFKFSLRVKQFMLWQAVQRHCLTWRPVSNMWSLGHHASLCGLASPKRPFIIIMRPATPTYSDVKVKIWQSETNVVIKEDFPRSYEANTCMSCFYIHTRSSSTILYRNNRMDFREKKLSTLMVSQRYMYLLQPLLSRDNVLETKSTCVLKSKTI